MRLFLKKLQLVKNVSIGANAVIEEGVVLGDNVIIGAGCLWVNSQKLARVHSFGQT